MNDHDPRPLSCEFAAERRGTFTWRYLMEGPEVRPIAIDRTPGVAEA